MSRVHDALRRAEQLLDGTLAPENDGQALVVKDETGLAGAGAPVEVPNPASVSKGLMRPEAAGLQIDARAFLARCKTIPFRPAPEAHLINPDEPHDGASEEFRSLRTRLNHMQAQQDLRVIVCTSASPAEGKTFTACNLALAQAQLELPVLLADLDLRRPVVHQQFQCERSPGFSDFLLGEKSLEECIRHVEGTNLYILPAGSAVRNPLELLNMRPVRYTLDSFRKVFNWVILDTPPLLFSADANLLATITDGIILVVRIGSTTYDSVVRAIQTLCENNVLGIVANGARAGELYSKYTYYYTKSEDGDESQDEDSDDEDTDEDDSAPQALPKHSPAVAVLPDAGTADAGTADGNAESEVPLSSSEGAGGTETEQTTAAGADSMFGEPEPTPAVAAPAKGGFFSRFRSGKKDKPRKVKAPVIEEDEDEDEDDE
jgi:receptor protein-tyrosine kinase